MLDVERAPDDAVLVVDSEPQTRITRGQGRQDLRVRLSSP
jgi:hypothetical protein